MLKSTDYSRSPNKSEKRKLSHSRSADDIPAVNQSSQLENLGAIKLQDFSQEYKK